MRADRLVALLLLMQARGRVTAREVAVEFEVSVATARRDLEALSAAGIPVYPQPGRHGGWSLLGGGRTDLSGLTAPEAQALFLLLGPAVSAGSGQGVDSAAGKALRKLVRALPGTFRRDAEAAAAAVMVDSARWGEATAERPALVGTLQDAVVRGVRVRFTYAPRGRGAAPGERLADPWGLVEKGGVWYLIAGTERGRRTYRVDRMLDVTVTDLPGARPEDFSLEASWREVVTEMERTRSLLSATVLVAERLVPVLRAQFGRHCEPLEVLDDGRARVRVAAPTARAIAQQLAGWGAELQAEAPESVRSELARIAHELRAAYGELR